MKQRLRLKLRTRPAYTALAVTAVLYGGGMGRALAQPVLQTAPAPNAPVRLNPTSHPITLTIPAMDGSAYMGDVVVTIDTNDRVQFPSGRVINLLSDRLVGAALNNLRNAFNNRISVSPEDFRGTGVSVTYNPQTLQLIFAIPVSLRTAQNVSVASMNRPQIGTFVPPAKFSAYMNARGSLNYVEQGAGAGLHSPVVFLDGAARAGGVALESEGVWNSGASNASSFQRQGTRAVYDDTSNLVRWTIGDLQPVAQGFQSVPYLTGASIFRSYSVLDPGMSVRPGGDQSFQWTRPSNVVITINGSNVQRLHLNPGMYNLRDFPFSAGANDVTVQIQDDTGRVQTLHFNQFYDQTQLAKGLTEFGLYAGVKSPLGLNGPNYTDQWEATGYLRMGVLDDLTLGANFQIDQHSAMGGYQALWATSIGTFGLDLAGSEVDGYGGGYAGTFTFQRLFQFAGGQGDSLNLAATWHSENFAPAGIGTPNNPYAYELTGGYTHAFDENLYGSFTAHYSKGQNGASDLDDYHAIVGYRLSDDLGLTVDTSYQSGGFYHGFGAMLSLTWRTSDSSSARGDFNTHFNDARLSYQDIHGSGVGSYNISADIERADTGSSFDGTANYIGNHAQFGVSHFTSTDAGFGTVNSQTTSLNFGTSVGFADGAVAIGRPVTQAFAIVEPHKSLKDADVLVDPQPGYYESQSDMLGNALDGELSAYVPRTVTVNVPDAPPGYNLGSGAFRINPPNRAGYRLVVGSDYSITVFGRLLNADGSPLSLIAGKAVELANPEHEPITLFTNRQGRFGLSGLKPGKWRIEMPTAPETDYILDVPDNGKLAIAAGDLKPETRN